MYIYKHICREKGNRRMHTKEFFFFSERVLNLDSFIFLVMFELLRDNVFKYHVCNFFKLLVHKGVKKRFYLF